MKVILFITIVFTNGTSVMDNIPTKNYDECFYLGRQITQEIQDNPEIKHVLVDCVEGDGG